MIAPTFRDLAERTVNAEEGPEQTDNSVDDDDHYVIEYLGPKPMPWALLYLG